MPALPTEARERLAALAASPDAAELGRRFTSAGYELALVGGVVRDALLGRPCQDLDLATDAHPPAVVPLLRGWADHVWDVGARFGTISARRGELTVEITTYRTDAYTAGSRHPEVTFGTDLRADLSRRDFTVNALAVPLPVSDPAAPQLLDPFGGLDDLARRVLRTPVDPRISFADDPLRMVRMARFAAVLDATATPEALDAATTMAAELDTISSERIRDELSKLIVAPAQARGIDLLCDTGLADRFLPEIPALRMERDPLHHHKDVYAHTLAVVDGCSPADDLVLRLAALLHDIGKPETRAYGPGGKVTFHHHEMAGARLADKRLKELRFPHDIAAQIVELVRLHLRFHGYADGAWTDSAVRRYVHDAGSAEQLRRLNTLTRADVTTRNRAKRERLQRAMDDLEERIRRLEAQEELRAIRPPLDGNEIMVALGLGPGPLVGAARRMLLDARIERGPMSAEEGHQLLREWAIEQGLTS
jgi:poly(A) polymerase